MHSAPPCDHLLYARVVEQLRTLVIGKREKFVLLQGPLLRNCRWIATLPDATQFLSQGGESDLVVLVQSYPEQYTQSDIEELRQSVPLARIVCLDGPWCEGGWRTGRRLQGVWRIYWHQQIPRLLQEFSRLLARKQPVWSSPLTASEDERLLCTLDASPNHAICGMHVAIDAQSDEWCTTLTAALSPANVQPIRRNRQETTTPPAAIVWDDEGRSLRTSELLDNLHHQFPSIPVIALLGFPRVEDVDCLINQHDAPLQTLAKPFDLRDLRWALADITGRSSIESSKSLLEAG